MKIEVYNFKKLVYNSNLININIYLRRIFNGKRTKENGFGEAGAYLNGETVQEVGGGVCQASSTLYNAVVLANLEVTERTNHTYISSYVPIGRDATDSWGGPDF